MHAFSRLNLFCFSVILLVDQENEQRRAELYTVVFERLISMATALNELTSCAVLGREADRLVRLLTRVYKFAVVVIKKVYAH